MINLPPKETFNYRECTFGGDACWLITPKELSIEWNNENSRFRSCVVRQSDGFVVSQGYRKFVNFGEKPDFEPWDSSWPVVARHKLDGSLLVVSKYKDEIIVRTRGNPNAYSHPNGDELRGMFNFEYLFDREPHTSNISYLFEWTSPSNVIVIRESHTPKLTLIGCITNDTAEYTRQTTVHEAAAYHGLPYPEEFSFKNIDDAINTVKNWHGREGVVIFSPDGQTLKKIKADEYCRLHKVAAGLVHINNVVDLFLHSPMSPHAKDFYNYVETTIDYEVAERLKDEISAVTEAYGKYLHTAAIIEREVDHVIRALPSRKEQAIAIARNWNGWGTSCAFNILDNKKDDIKIIEKAIKGYLK